MSDSAIGLGILLGAVARLYMLRSDYRRYPSYPHGYVIHLALGLVAAAVGAVAPVALMAREYVAVTFLTLVAQQFREIRRMERESLQRLDEWELVRRGPDYIEGIARVFEARNYLVMMVALITSWTTAATGRRWPGLVAGAAAMLLAAVLTEGQRLGKICRVQPASLHFRGPDLYVGDIRLMNVGLPRMREEILRWGLGLILEPVDQNAVDSLANVGQRQALLHDLTAVLGTRRDLDVAELAPLARRDGATGRVGVVIVPAEPDLEAALEAARRVPLLEASRGRALKSQAGRRAAD